MDNATSPSFPNLVALSEALAGIVDAVGRSSFAVIGRRGHAIATAVVWRPGLLVTAAHVFRRQPPSVRLVGADGRSHDASWVGSDPSTDIAVLRIADEAVPAVTVGDADAVRAGHWVVAVGRSTEGDLVASQGSVGRTGGAWQTWLGGRVDRLIRLDGGLYDGLSGAPIASAHGTIIGIGSAALSRSHGVVLPAATLLRVVDDLLAHGRVGRAWLGIAAQTVPVPGGEGLLVTALADGGPAAQAGVLVGDIVTAAAGQPTASLAALRAALAQQIGRSVPLALLRGGVPTEAAIVVGEWPAERRGC